MGSTSELASYAAGAKYEDLPAEVVEKAKDLVLDVLGCSIGGYPISLSKKFLSLARDIGSGRAEASLIGTGEKVAATAAAFGNGALATMLDYNDFYSKGGMSGIWPGAIGVPAAMAAAEKTGISGRDFLNSVVVGYEVSSRVAASMSWSTQQWLKVAGSTTSVFAAAVAAAKAFSAGQEEMLSTLGMAGTYAPVSAFRKYLCAECHPVTDVKQGWAWMCFTGMFAAESAMKGLRMIQKDNILDGPNGFWVMVGADGFNEYELTAGLGEKYNILNAATKSHTGCATTHAPVDAVNAIVKENKLKLDEIERINVSLDGLISLGCAVQDVDGVVEAEFSAPYQVAVSLLAGKEGPGWYSDEMLQNPEILKMAKKVHVIHDEECTASMLKGGLRSWFTKGEVHMKSGKQYSKRTNIRVLSKREEFRNKFIELAEQVVGRGRAEAVMNDVYGLEKAENIKSLVKKLYPI